MRLRFIHAGATSRMAYVAGVVSALLTQARNVPPMLAMCAGVPCSTMSWQR